MDRQIIADCQTKNAIIHCDDCIWHTRCKLREKCKKENNISAVDLKDMEVWQTWKSRKPLPP
ncbi:MAG: hypothetical protein ACQCN3_15585 [Candidatus Bathyarchaeia archaeon]